MDRRQILIVDDYPGALYLRARILGDAGYEVLEATNGEDALRMVAKHHPALVLLDVNLPDISGTEVCERLKGEPATAGIPVIQITGAWISNEARQRGLTPLARIVAQATSGLPPKWVMMTPVDATST